MVCVPHLSHTVSCIAFPLLQISRLCVFCDILSPKAVYRVLCPFFRCKMFSPGDRVWYHSRTCTCVGGEYQARCTCGARMVRVPGLRAHQVPSTTRLPVDHLLEKFFKYLTQWAHGADTSSKSVICLYSVIFFSKGGVQVPGCHVPFSDPRRFLPVTVYDTNHPHLVHMCWPLLWGLHQMGCSFATFGTCALVGSLKWIMRVLNSQGSRMWWLHHPSSFARVLFLCISRGYHSLP